jgi:adenosylmethionine-8-amino-7-oxononanoate aminotransferase
MPPYIISDQELEELLAGMTEAVAEELELMNR